MDATQIKVIVPSAGNYEVDFTSSITDYNTAILEYGPDANYGTTVNARGTNGAYVAGFASTMTSFHFRCTVTDFSSPPVVDSSGDQVYGTTTTGGGGGKGGHDDDGDGDHDGRGRGDRDKDGRGGDGDADGDRGRGGDRDDDRVGRR